MVVNCPHCEKQLKLSEKIQKSIGSLSAGKKIKVKCIHCSEAFGLDQGGKTNAIGGIASGAPQKLTARLRPPSPPSIDWLVDGEFDEKEIIEDIPRALVLLPEMEVKKGIIKAAEDFGYLVEQVETPEEAIDKMRFVNYSAVFLHEHYENGGIGTGKFHQFMCRLSMSKRRYIYYVLIGPQFRTLYDLEALAYSANLVVNDTEAGYIATLLRKTIPEYEELFGPVMEELRMAGK